MMKDETHTGAAVVTGGASDIGAAIAERFLDDGMYVVLCDRDGARMAAWQGGLSAPDRAACITIDLSNSEAVQSFADEVIARHGRVDVLVNCAAINPRCDILDVTLDDLELSYAVNLRAPVILSQAFAASMRKRGGGAIVNIASVHGMTPGPYQLAYSTMKSAMLGLTRSMAVDLGRYNIRVNAVIPTAIRTRALEAAWEKEDEARGGEGRVLDYTSRQHPLKRIGEVDDIAEAVQFLAHAKYVTGSALPVDGGLLSSLRLLPIDE